MTTLTRRWQHLRLFVAQKILHTNDTPHAIALGAGMAMLIALLPLVGLQMVIALGVAVLLKANKAVCIPVVWVTNPVTMGPIYYGCYRLGRAVLPASWTAGDAGLGRLVELARSASLFDAAFWKNMVHVLVNAGLELWVGCTIVGVVAGVVTYVVTRSLVVGYRERRRQRMLRRSMFRPSKLDSVVDGGGGAPELLRHS